MIKSETQGAVDVMRITGTLSAEQRDDLCEQVARVSHDGAPMVVLDMCTVQLVDSDGLELLLDVADEVHHHGGDVRMAALSPLVADVLRTTGVADQFEIHDTVAAAVGSFAK